MSDITTNSKILAGCDLGNGCPPALRKRGELYWRPPPPLSTVPLSEVPVTPSPLRSENSKWKLPDVIHKF